MKQRILVITGATASGKSALALKLAEELDGEIICADSLTVYRGFDIGSAKPDKAEQQRIPHHLLDIREPAEPFTAADFRIAAAKAVDDCISRGRNPIIAGGTGLYIRSLLNGLNGAPGEEPAIRDMLVKRVESEGVMPLLSELNQVDPDTARNLHPNNVRRIIRALEVYLSTGMPLSRFNAEHRFSDRPYHTLQFCLAIPRNELYNRIDNRVEAMISAGLIEEVKQHILNGISPDAKPMQSIGYKEVTDYLSGRQNQAEMIRLIKRNTRYFAKRQLTWFRREPELDWVAYPENSATILDEASKFFN